MKATKRQIRKLTLEKETLRALQDDDLSRVAGGNPVETQAWVLCEFAPTDPTNCLSRSCPP